MLGLSMKKIFSLAAVVGAGLTLAGCGYTPEERAGSGAAIGGATGRRPSARPRGGGVAGTLVGGALGAATGAIVGANTRPPPPPPPGYYPPPPPPPPRCAQFVYDPYGNPHCNSVLRLLKPDTALSATVRPIAKSRRAQGRRVPNSLILHYTGLTTGEAAVQLLCDPVAEVSSHYLALEDGSLLQLVPESRRAWHAGRGVWAGESDNERRLDRD